MARLASMTCVAWLAGLIAYEGFLRLIWNQSIGSEWIAVGLWSGIAATAAAAFYNPILGGVHKILDGYRPRFWFPLVSVILAPVPAAIIILAWDGNLRAIFSEEGGLFLAMFTVFGLVFGLGYTYRRSAISS